MEAFLYITWTIAFILHILLNLVIQDAVCKDDFVTTNMLPRFWVVPLILAIITFWWKPSGHPAEDKKILGLMKAGNYASIAFIICTLLVFLSVL